MSASINQKAYLQKYLAGPSGDKKKKKKKAIKGTGLKIIDDDIDLSKLRALDGDELDVFDQGEDAPQIAGIIDDRPEEVKKAEQFSSSSKWKVVSQDDGFNSKLEIEEIKSDIKQAEKENELIFGKMYSDSEDEQKNDSDLSPPRKQDQDPKAKASKPSKKHDSDSDFSPPRKRDERSPKRRNDDRFSERKEDKSPRRKHNDRSPNGRHEKSPKRKGDQSPKRSYDKSPKRKSRDRSPKRKEKSGDKFSSSPKRKNDRSPTKEKGRRNDADLSPARPEKPKERVRKPSRWGDFSPESRSQSSKVDHSPKRADDRNSSTARKARRESSPRQSKNYDSDASPPRKSKKSYDSDQSPPRKSKKKHDSPSRKSKKSYDSDVSPPRKSNTKRNRSPEFVSPSKKLRYSPQRHSHKDRHDKHQSNTKPDKPRKHRHSSDSDLSPPRKNKRQKSTSPSRKNKKPQENNKRKYNSDSDQSPPRKERDRSTSERDRRRGNDSPPPSNKKMAKTLEGKMAGLQDARQLRQENENFRKKEDEVFNKMSDEVSGRNAQAVSRKSKRETSEERLKLKEKAERQKELDEKYKKWTKGNKMRARFELLRGVLYMIQEEREDDNDMDWLAVKQLEEQEARVQEFLHESSKPLARLRDDRDLEDNLRQVERDGDPMLKYMRDRKRERGELGPEKPTYKGNFPPNRFNIRPGYRWDGVDRSNGYENKFFEQQSKRKAQEEEAYKWSTEDL